MSDEPAPQSGRLNRLRKMLGGSDLRRDLMRGGLGSLAIKVAHAVLAFMVAVTLARLLGPAGYGVYAFALAVLTIVALPAKVGLPQLVVRETAKAQADGDYGLMRGLWRWSNKLVAMFSVFALAGLVAMLWLMEPSPKVTTLAVGAALVPFIALANLRSASLRGLRRVVMGQLPESIIRPLVLLAIVFAASGLGLDGYLSRPEAAVAAYVAAALVAFVAGAVMLRRARPTEFVTAEARTASENWRNAILPLSLISGLSLVNSQAAIIAVGFFRSDDEVGFYRAAFQLAILITFGAQTLKSLLQPYYARLHQQGDPDRLQRLVFLSSRIMLTWAIIPVTIFYAYGGQILSIVYGDAFTDAARVLILLAIAQLIASAFGNVGTVLTMTNNERAVARGFSLSVLVNLVLLALLVPFFGGEGAAISAVLSVLVLRLTLIRALKEALNLRVLW